MASADLAKRRCAVCHATYTGDERFCSLDGGAIVDDAATDPLIGQTIDGRYFVRRWLGRGGMGTVYEADHVGLDKRVAIKFLSHDDADRDASARFRREARAASRVIHEHVVQIFDVGSDAGRDYIVMEFLDGRDLRQQLAAAGPLDPARATEITRQMLYGLDAIHQAGIIHRDIKPANVLLTTRDDVVKIMDFGISKSIHVAETLTGTGKVVGTPQYMAPEQLSDGEVDHRADLYATGLTLFAMLAGEAPFGGSTQHAAMRVHEAAPSLDDVKPGLPPALVAAVARALERSPEARYADALEFAAALGDAPPSSKPALRRDEAATVDDRKPGSRPIAATARVDRPRPRQRWLIVVAIAALAAGIVIAMELRKPATKAAELVAMDASRASIAVQQLAIAEAAENDGKLELAIAAYQEVAAAQAGAAGPLIHIAQLYERLGNAADAVSYYQRYLDAAPNARDRDAVIAKIAALRPPIGDAGVVVRPDAAPARRAVSRASTKHCICLPLDVQRYGLGSLCPTQTVPLCRCKTVEGADTCRGFVPCPAGAPCERWGNTDVACSDPKTNTYHLPGKTGDECAGFTNPTHAVRGRLECVYGVECAARSYVGSMNDPCNGHTSDTGEMVRGRMIDCHE